MLLQSLFLSFAESVKPRAAAAGAVGRPGPAIQLAVQHFTAVYSTLQQFTAFYSIYRILWQRALWDGLVRLYTEGYVTAVGVSPRRERRLRKHFFVCNQLYFRLC